MTIEQVHIDAFFNDRINIKVSNSSAEIFGYPGFRIYDENQNLIGEEEVWFFGIGTESNHVVYFNAAEQGFETLAEYNLTIELWVGFYSELKCTFEINTILLPQPIDCIDVGITFSEFSSETVSYVYTLSSASGTEIHTEVLQFQPNVGAIDRYFCLLPGCYELSASTDIDSEFAQLNINMQALDSYGFLFSELLYQEQENAIQFGLWADCSALNSNEIRTDKSFVIFPNPSDNQIFIKGPINAEMCLYDSLGKLIQKFTYQAHEDRAIDINSFAKGIYHIRSFSPLDSFSLSFIKK